jgi:hypothetical protein
LEVEAAAIIDCSETTFALHRRRIVIGNSGALRIVQNGVRRKAKLGWQNDSGRDRCRSTVGEGTGADCVIVPRETSSRRTANCLFHVERPNRGIAATNGIDSIVPRETSRRIPTERVFHVEHVKRAESMTGLNRVAVSRETAIGQWSVVSC